MAGVTVEAAAARRGKVAELHVRGFSLTAIAVQLETSWRTVKSDVQLLAKEWAQDDDLDGERRRLLRAAKAVEAEAWRMYHRASPAQGAVRLGALSKALAAQAQGLAVVSAIAALDVERRLADLEQRLDASAGTTGRTAWSMAGRN